MKQEEKEQRAAKLAFNMIPEQREMSIQSGATLRNAHPIILTSDEKFENHILNLCSGVAMRLSTDELVYMGELIGQLIADNAIKAFGKKKKANKAIEKHIENIEDSVFIADLEGLEEEECTCGRPSCKSTILRAEEGRSLPEDGKTPDGPDMSGITEKLEAIFGKGNIQSFAGKENEMPEELKDFLKKSITGATKDLFDGKMNPEEYQKSLNKRSEGIAQIISELAKKVNKNKDK